MKEDALIHWRSLTLDDEGWNRVRCLYAYIALKTREILYIGKAWNATVRARWNRSGKYDFWDDLERQRGIHIHHPLIGEIELPPHHRLSRELLSDIESLLIHQVQPWGNIQSRSSRISRPGFTIKCLGVWPSRNRIFSDGGE
jgi:hypothetical protein